MTYFSSVSVAVCARGNRCTPCWEATTSAYTKTRRRGTLMPTAKQWTSPCRSASRPVWSTSRTATPSARTCCGWPPRTASTSSRLRTERTCWPGSESFRRTATWTRRWDSCIQTVGSLSRWASTVTTPVRLSRCPTMTHIPLTSSHRSHGPLCFSILTLCQTSPSFCLRSPNTATNLLSDRLLISFSGTRSCRGSYFLWIKPANKLSGTGCLIQQF